MPNSPTLLAASIAAAFGSFATLTCAADPLPTGGKVVVGQASISKPTPNTLQVQQGSANAAIDWASFSVGRDASVTFQQPSARSIVLNRVVGSDPSQILGRIQANGQVFLINPYGIVFGRDAKVDVAGLVASTANIRNDDFMAGRLRFTSPGQPGASVVNEGQITVREGGLAALMAPSVANHGTITAWLGTVALASGEAFTLDPYGDRLIGWVVPASQLSSVVNEGTLSADGGSVQISARAAASVVDGVINLGGAVRARTVGERGGRVVLDGDRGVLVAGSIDASGGGAGERGGSVQASAATIRLTDSALVDASGDAGGGTVHLGGGWRGAGGSGTVASTSIDRGARIDVRAINTGSGGEAVVWSDGHTAFSGHIDARGATRGGQVEVSGHRLAYDGSVDAASAHGTAGTLLLDPGSLVVQSRTAAAPAAGTDVVTTESVNTQLAAGTNVQLTATQDLTVADRIDARLVNARGTRVNTTGANLALSAGGNLALNGDVILDGGSFTGTAGGKFVQATTGALLATGGGDVSLQAGQGITLQIVQGARNLTLKTTSGSIELATPIGLSGRFTADVIQAQTGDRVHLNGLIAASPDAQPAVAINRAAGNTGAAAVVIDDHTIAAGKVSIQGSTVTLATAKAIDTRAASGGRAGSTVTVDAGTGGLALNGNVYTDNAAVTLNSQGDITQANAAAIATGSSAITLAGSGTTTVSRIQTTDALSAIGARVVFDAGTTDFTIQAGTLQVNATGSAANAIDIHSSIKLGTGNSSFASTNDFTMQPGTLIQAGATGTFAIDAARNITVESLQTAGAGTLIRSAHGNVVFNQPLGGRAAGDNTTVVTQGGDTVPVPTLYALDVRAPEGRIVTNGLLLYGLRGAPLTLDMPAAGILAYGLNLAASEVDVRGLVFVFDGAVSIQGTTRVLLGNSVRSVGAFPMAVGGGEVDVYRPTHPDGTPYQNTDIVVAQYGDGSLKFFEKINGVWVESTSFVSVVMPADLPQGGTAPAYWINRLQPSPLASTVSLADFTVAGQAPVQLVSLPNTTLTGTGQFAGNQGLDSYDSAGRNPFVPLTYGTDGPPALAGTEVFAQAGTQLVTIPGTRFVPKVLISNDPGPAFNPTTVLRNGVPTTNVGRINLRGQVYETDAQGNRLVHDTPTTFDSGGDLRNVAFKVVTFDTRSIYQDSPIAPTFQLNQNALGTCTSVAGTCLDDPLFQFQRDPSPAPPLVGFNDIPRIVYPDTISDPRVVGSGSGTAPLNPVSVGFQAGGYLLSSCSGSACERPTVPLTDPARTAYFLAGEQPKAGANPNANSASLVWLGVQPGPNSAGRFEFIQAQNFFAGFGGNAVLKPSEFNTSIAGLTTLGGIGSGAIGVYKIGSSVTQATPLATFDPATPTRTVLAINFGIMLGQGIAVGVDGTSAFKSSLPSVSIAANDGSGSPSFSTIIPTTLSVGSGGSTLPITSSLPPVPVSVPVQPPVTAPQPGDNSASGSAVNALLNDADDPTPVAANETAAGTGTLLVLGGRGVAQSLDMGRSGGLGSTRSASASVDYEVACTVAEAPRDRNGKRTPARRDTPLPVCR